VESICSTKLQDSDVTGLISELRRRSVFRVAASYVVVGWIIIQVVSAVSTPLALPEWFETAVIVLLGIGFPIALIFAWAFDLTPDGIKRAHSGDEFNKRTVGSKLDYALIIGLIVVAVVTLVEKSPSSISGDPAVTFTAEGSHSIAVLPFVDMSPDGDQEYFGDGIAEELLNELTRLEGLHVASRTSSFSFKHSGSDSKTIAEALGVKSILEGSIRKDGNQIRITAQLINAADDFHVWSATYDRELADIFAIQEEIATSVAGALGVRLGVGGVNAFHGAGTKNVEAYELYLRVIQLNPAADFAKRIQLLERAIELDPNYAAAWAAHGLTVASAMWNSLPEDAPAILENAYPLVVRAVELNPASGQAQSLLATILYPRHDWIGAAETHVTALSLLSDRPTVSQHANLLMRAGRSAAARAKYAEAESLEPLDGTPSFMLYVSLAEAQYDEAQEVVNSEWSDRDLLGANLEIALNRGESEGIKTAIRALPTSTISTNTLYLPVLRQFDSPEMALSTLLAVYSDASVQWPSKFHDIALLAAYFDDPAFALRVKAEEVRNTPVRQGALWYPVMSDVRRLPAFKELVTDINLVAYWGAYGWADVCRPLGVDDFECR